MDFIEEEKQQINTRREKLKKVEMGERKQLTRFTEEEEQ